MRHSKVLHLLLWNLTGETALGIELVENALIDEVFPFQPGYGWNEFARHNVQLIVIIVLRTKIADGLEVAQAMNDVRACKAVRPRPQHQVAHECPETTAMRKQIGHCEFFRNPRIVHLEVRNIVDNLVVPIKPTLVDEHRERGRRHGLGQGRDSE